ncbi:MAG: helix-turn-helix transcriptional regulator [Opitutaceae bacterium]|nr:helix-turn-helix transcriptional regulator [Opitutaceae bacterium]
MTFGDVVYQPGGRFGPRVQSDYQLVVLVDGAMQIEVDGVPREVQPGHVTLLRPGGRENFAFSAVRKSHHTWCALRPGIVSAELRDACAQAASVLPVTHRFAQLMELGLAMPLTAGTQAHGLIDALGLAVLQAYLFTDARQQRRAADEPDTLRRALAWVGQEDRERTDLPTMAAAAGVSPTQLVTLFKRHLGTTPLRYVWETRTRRGAQLLRETGLTVGDVAFRCHVQTPVHFSRWIKQLYGVPPKALRARAWGA